MYLNGILIGSSAKIRSVQTNNNFEVNIGRQFNQNQYMFNGKLDEVVIFNRALSSEEVKNLYDGTRKN
jgi:hypothetical protein